MDWLSILVGAGVGPLVTYAVKKIPAVEGSRGEELGAVINLGLTVGLFVLAGALLPLAYSELPRELDAWVQMGMAAAAAGNAGNNLYKKGFAAPKKKRTYPRRAKP